jgi:hypothetical protein
MLSPSTADTIATWPRPPHHFLNTAIDQTVGFLPVAYHAAAALSNHLPPLPLHVTECPAFHHTYAA